MTSTFDDHLLFVMNACHLLLLHHRYSQVAPQDMFTEKNTRTNLPAQIDLYAVPGNAYNLVYMAKVGHF